MAKDKLMAFYPAQVLINNLSAHTIVEHIHEWHRICEKHQIDFEKHVKIEQGFNKSNERIYIRILATQDLLEREGLEPNTGNSLKRKKIIEMYCNEFGVRSGSINVSLSLGGLISKSLRMSLSSGSGVGLCSSL